MKKSLSLSIPQPCHEKWQNFTSTSHGGFCSSCQKEVIDFTSWGENDIKDYFKNRAQPTCGRFQPSQLKIYSLVEAQPSPIPKWIPLSVLGFSLIVAQPAGAQKIKQSSLLPVQITVGKVQKEGPDQPTDPVQINGFVKDIDQQPIAGVDIILNGTSLNTITDAEGCFSLTLPNPTPADTIIVSRIGYGTQVLNVYKKNNLTIEMAEEHIMMGVIANVQSKQNSKGIWRRIKNKFR